MLYSLCMSFESLNMGSLLKCLLFQRDIETVKRTREDYDRRDFKTSLVGELSINVQASDMLPRLTETDCHTV